MHLQFGYQPIETKNKRNYCNYYKGENTHLSYTERILYIYSALHNLCVSCHYKYDVLKIKDILGYIQAEHRLSTKSKVVKTILKLL